MRYPQASTYFLSYGTESFGKLAKYLQTIISSTKMAGIVLISDLGMNDDSNLVEICSKIFDYLEQNNWKATWIDHHPWPINVVNTFARRIELVLDDSGNKCAADLMYGYLLKDNVVAAKLASMAHAMDFFTKEEYLTPVAELIRYYSNFEDFYERLTKLARKASEGILWDIEMGIEYSHYVNLRDYEKKESISSMKIKDVDGIKVIFVKSSRNIQNSLFADELFCEPAPACPERRSRRRDLEGDFGPVRSIAGTSGWTSYLASTEAQSGLFCLLRMLAAGCITKQLQLAPGLALAGIDRVLEDDVEVGFSLRHETLAGGRRG